MKRVKNDLTKLPVFGPDLGICEECELQDQRDKGNHCTSYRPQNFNGLMIIGEGPGRHEVLQKRPFVGKSGRLLRAGLEGIGLNLDECYVANATLCKPSMKVGAALYKEYPHAIQSCLGRLEEEIAAVRPRVIMPLGAVAWIAISGYDKTSRRNVDNPCDKCDEHRKVGPVLQCNAPVVKGDGTTAEACGHLHFLNATCKEDVNPDEVVMLKAKGCASCGAKLSRVRPKMVKCPACGGRKKKSEEYVDFKWDYNLGSAAGGIFTPGRESREEAAHTLDPWLAAQGVKYVVPSFHPAYILRGQQFLAKTLQKHMAKVKRLLEGGTPEALRYTVTSDPKVVREFCWVWASQKLPDGGSTPAHNFAVDIETKGRPDPAEEGKRLDATLISNVERISCIGIGTAELGILVVDTRYVDPSGDDPLLDALYDFLTDDRIPKTYHNGAGYDLLVLDMVWGVPWHEQVNSYTDDSQYGHINLYPDSPHKLGHVAFESADVLAWKPAKVVKGEEVHESFEELCEYNARDVLNTDLARVHHGIDRGRAIEGGRMDRAGLSKVYEQDSILRRIGVGMTMRGMCVDPVGWAKAGETAQEHLDQAQKDIDDVLEKRDWGDFNPRSAPQKVKLLYKSDAGFKLPVLKTTATGNPSCDGDTLRKLLAETRNEDTMRFLRALALFLDHDYVAKNYVNSAAMQPWADGRIHPVWKPWGAKTGRWTSSPNAQNWPKWLRALIVAPPGRKIVGADYDQLELRNMGVLSGDEELIRRCMKADDTRKLEPDCDPHSYVASLAFKDRFTSLALKDSEHDKTDPKCACQTCRRKALRDLTKRVIYGLNYGAGASKVLESIYEGGYEGPPITVDMIALVRRTLFATFPGIERWRDAQVARAMATGELRSPICGRRRIFPLGEVPITEIYNFPIQAMGADIMNTQLIELDRALPGVDPSAFVFAQVHDAIYIEADEKHAEAVAKLLQETLTVERDGMIFTAGAAISDNWKEAA